MTWEWVAVLALMMAVAVVCFWSGYHFARGYLNASESVADIAGAAVRQANTFSSQLEKLSTDMAQLQATVQASTRVADAKYAEIELTVREFFEALQTSGVVTSAPRRTGPARQHGEAAGD